jgi:2-polyprenyl-6-methoxyphenol hydroxylase-like FAD-dependent oxidoreductase
LLGDAIHTMTPGRGEGANTALRDAGLLHDALVDVVAGRLPLVNAVARYQAEMLRYGFQAVADSLTDLVGELSTRSEQFRVRWASHDVRQYRSGTQPFHHPLVGDLTLSYEALELTADIGQTLIVYTAQPDSPSQQALNRLASWSTAPNQASRQR